MSGVLQYLNPVEDMTLSDRKNHRQAAVASLISRTYEKKIGNPDDVPGWVQATDPGAKRGLVLNYLNQHGMPPSVDVREGQPTLDFQAVNDRWDTAVLALIATPYTVFNGSVLPTLAASKVAVFYKVGILEAPMPVSRLIFRSSGAAGNIIAIFDLEQLIPWGIWVGYFSEPVVMDPTLPFSVTVFSRIGTGFLTNVELGVLVAEPRSATTA